MLNWGGGGRSIEGGFVCFVFSSLFGVYPKGYPSEAPTFGDGRFVELPVFCSQDQRDVI